MAATPHSSGIFDNSRRQPYASPVVCAGHPDTKFRVAWDDLMVISPRCGGRCPARELAKRINSPSRYRGTKPPREGRRIAEMTVIGDVTRQGLPDWWTIFATPPAPWCKAAESIAREAAKEGALLHQPRRDVRPSVETHQQFVMKSLVITDSTPHTGVKQAR